jgi:hypothetical protein
MFLRFFLFLFTPRYRYWLVEYTMTGQRRILRAKLNPISKSYTILLDGPFTTQEDAARALAFWRCQYPVQQTVKV